MTKGKIDKLQKEYIDLSVCVLLKKWLRMLPLRILRYSLLCLPSNLKKEHNRFLREAKADIKEG